MHEKGKIVIASPNLHGLQRWDNNKNINNTEVRKEPSKSQKLKVMLRKRVN